MIRTVHTIYSKRRYLCSTCRFTAQSSAIYVRPNDELEFVRAIAELTDSPERRQQMAAIGHRIEQQLAWDYSVSRLLGAYDCLVKPSYQKQPD